MSKALGIQRELAITTAEFGRKLATVVDDAIFHELPPDHAELTTYAHRLRLCNQDNNLWTATDLHTRDGELYDGTGRFWHCGSKLCPYCLSRISRRNRSKLRRAIHAQKLLSGENYEFITLTQVNLGQPLNIARSIFNRAWTLFRKNRWFTRTIVGASKSEEFTFTKTGYNYHCHILARAKYIDYNDLRFHWTAALKKSYDLHKLILTPATKDGMVLVQCDRLGQASKTVWRTKPNASGERQPQTQTVQAAILECCKYITKSDSWSKIPKHDLLEICRIRRFPRMFELIGSFKIPTLCVVGDEQIKSEEQSTTAATPTGDDPGNKNNDRLNKTILDTKTLSDAPENETWRDIVRTKGALVYLEHLESQIEHSYPHRCRQLKQLYPYATFKRLRNTPQPDTAYVKHRFELIERERTYKSWFYGDLERSLQDHPRPTIVR